MIGHRMLRHLTVGLVLAVAATACGSGSGASDTTGAPSSTSTTMTTTTIDVPPTDSSETTPTTAPLTSPVGNGLYDPSDHAEASPPTSIDIDALGISSATVVAVGVGGDGEYEVPPADEVGWYRFGPTPGATGSAVLAAHIAYDGVDGVFRHLTDLDGGEEIRIGFGDGTTRRFEVTERVQYDKDELPVDELFDRSVDPVLTLITCGGSFDSSNRSYEDNIVVRAVPAD